MSIVEIVIVSAISLFTLYMLMRALGWKFKIKDLFKPREKKEKKSKESSNKKSKKVKKEKVKKSKEKPSSSDSSQKRVEKVTGKDAGKSLEDLEKEKNKQDSEKNKEQTTNQDQKKTEKAFQITKKGVAKIHKKALERDSRSLAKIEPAIVRGQKIDPGFSSFDDMLDKMKAVGDPDDLDSETFRSLFMKPDFESGNINDDFLDPDDQMSADFISAESPESGKIDRRLKHYTIEGKHLRIIDNYDNYPIRRPMLPDHIDFTERITGRYSNITMGDVSNRLAPPEESTSPDDKALPEHEDSDEDIFAKIMERRRREMGIPMFGEEEQTETDNSKEIDMETLVIADAIMKPAHTRFKNTNKQ